MTIPTAITTDGLASAISARKSISTARWSWRFLYIFSFAVWGYLLADGFSYYATPYAERPHQERYRQLRPAGSRGLAFGIAGSAMMVLMLVYSLRKRTRLLGRLGKLPQWLNFHIYLGIMGPLFILLHSSFKVQGLVAVSFWSMVVVAASGVFGRYLYQRIPRNIQGHQLSLQELEELNRSYASRFQEEFGLSEEQVGRLDRIVERNLAEPVGLWKALWLAFRDEWLLSAVHRHLRNDYVRKLRLPKMQAGALVELAEKKAELHRRVLLLGQMQKLFHYWHVVHKPFAIIMYLVMAIHIGVAPWTGYAWNF